MKIVFLTTTSLESPAGLRYLPFAKALLQRGHECTLLALHHDLQPDTARRMEVDGVQVRYVGQMHVRKVGHLKHYYSTAGLLRVVFASVIQMMVHAARLDCDLIHLGKPQPVNGLAGLVGGRLLRKRRLFVDCDDYEAKSNRLANAWLRRAVTLFEDNLPRLAAGVTTNTRFLQQRCLSLGVAPARIAYVPAGIDRQRFVMPAAAQVESLRRCWGLEGCQVVGYVGSMSLTGHAVDLLLQAFAQLQSRQRHAVLLLVGGGEDYDYLRAQAERLGLAQAVRFTGRVPAGDVPAYLALSDVTTDPVLDDMVARARSPLKIVESLAVGTPVVTGDVGDRREMLADGQAGVLVAPGDPRALADGLAQILSQPDRMRCLSEGALHQRERYYWDVLIGQVLDLYESTP
jgi:glycosyltransferase involved in cell wall biosynthesis